MANRKQIEKEIIAEEIMGMNIQEDIFEEEEEIVDADFDLDDYMSDDDFDDEISPEELLDAEIEAKGLNPRCMEDVEKYFEMKGDKK